MAATARVVPAYLHTALRVRDLEGALGFFTEVVGLRELRRGGDAARPTSVWLEGIQLVRAETQDTAEKGVLDHIGLSVANLDDLVASLEANGVALEAPVRATTLPDGQRQRVVFFRDPEGNRIELTERS